MLRKFEPLYERVVFGRGTNCMLVGYHSYWQIIATAENFWLCL